MNDEKTLEIQFLDFFQRCFCPLKRDVQSIVFNIKNVCIQISKEAVLAFIVVHHGK
jgi:hypothetical protein